MTYNYWNERLSYPKNFNDIALSFSIKGESLDIGNANLYFWILAKQRYHLISYPITINNNEWTSHRIIINDESNFIQSYYGYPNNSLEETLSYNLSNVDSYGFSFIGFKKDQPVTGAILMKDFQIEDLISQK